MRYHSAAHVWRRVFQELGTEITGGQLAVDRRRFDFARRFYQRKIEEIFSNDAVVALSIHAASAQRKKRCKINTV